MSDAAALNRRLGIELGYVDQIGKREAIPAETVEQLWRTLLPGDGGVEPRQLLAELAAEEAGRIVEPVIVATARTPTLRLALNLPRSGKVLHWGITAENGDFWSGQQHLPDAPAGRGRRRRLALRLPGDLALGYHRLTLSWDGRSEGEASTHLILAPARAHLPPGLEGGHRAWGLAAQLYALRSPGNWGIGDFSDLGELLTRAAKSGAAAVGVNPLHALFPDEPARASPYSPSSRLFLNPLYVDVPAVADFAECEPARALLAESDFADALTQARQVELVDYPAVAALKRRAMTLLYRNFRERHLGREGDPRAEAFRAFRAEGGQDLRRFAVFETLREHLAGDHPRMRSWRAWPAAYRRPDSAAVRRFAAEHAEAIEFVEYQQWQADLQLAGAAAVAKGAGMEIGVYRDLAVGFDPDGADAWVDQSCSALDWSVGAPPDAWNMKGQMWGMPPLNPRALRASGYRPLTQMLRANMRHAGALRIDHALGLKRLFWIPRSGGPKDGAYVYYPVEEMLGVVALESQRNRCLVVGEDLGTVPEGFSEMLQSRGILSYRLLYFMRGPKGAFLPPSAWPRDALAQVSTHDLPTLTGFWTGRDIDAKQELSLFPDRASEQADRKNRPVTLKDLGAALAREHLPVAGKRVPLEQVHRFLARSRSRLAMLQLEDLAGALDQINMPGTTDEHPNWRRKLPLSTSELFAELKVRRLLAAVAAERGRPAALAAARALRGRRSEGPAPSFVPQATYRLQLNASFGFEAASALLPYLGDLGISHVYLSPILEAQPGSAHGYDGTSYERLNPDLGGAEGFERFSDKLRHQGLKLIVDFVPNHMGIGQMRNRWWLELLEGGQRSPAAEIFDVDWTPPWPELEGKILVPFLADSLAEVAARGELPVRFDREQGRFDIWYFEHRLPLRPQDYAEIIRASLPESPCGTEDAGIEALRRLARGFEGLSDGGAATRQRAADMQTGLALLAGQSPAVARVLSEAAARFAVKPGDSQALAALERLLSRQHYRLDHWRLAATRANYRRFFDISQLIGIRMERPAVFDRTHGLIGRLIAEGKLDGLRLDHVDGLKDPAAYCRRLRRFVERQVRTGGGERSRTGEFYIAVEKILGAEEKLRADWPVQGTTGYEFIALLNGLFTDPAGARPLQRICEGFAGKRLRFDAILAEAKAQVIDSSFVADLDRLTARFQRLAPRFEADELRAALRGIAIGFPLYRSYVSTAGAAPEDRRLIDRAVAAALGGVRGRRRAVFSYLRGALKGGGSGRSGAVVDAAMRFQQFTAPVMAKGLEDTSFYRYPRLLSLNEVGGAPALFGLTVAVGHRALAERRARWPGALLATATHDTKRGEDSRARLNVLSEIPTEWARRVRRWARLNKGLRKGRNGAPRPIDEYFIYQTLVGAWPFEFLAPGRITGSSAAAFLERMKAYLVKALREAKQETSWLDPDIDYERACLGFLEGLLDRRRSREFIEDLTDFLGEIAPFGVMNSLAQLILKLTAPGVADIYQGSELWDLSLVDPDNRRPVDFAARRNMLSDAMAAASLESPARRKAWEELRRGWRDGRIKLHVIAALLALRRRCPALFAEGSYEPLGGSGLAARHLFAFRRRQGDRGMLVAVGRFFARLHGASDKELPGGAAWGSTHLTLPPDAPTSYIDLFTGTRIEAKGRRLALAPLFALLPVAVLVDEA
ncbi:MAG TPA: malto-oligosyltrehalose synthase [Verrucomicrobiae bacterium]|nr:malto-oligosyltrehalose synthase [Verrucomicrobiae bacterium]